MAQSATVKVSNRYQISLPSLARKRLNIEAGDRLLVEVHDGFLILLPQPESYVAQMASLHSEIWEGVDTARYLKEERESWSDSTND